MTFPRFVTLILIVAATCGLLAITTSGGGSSDRAGSVSVAPRTPTSSTPTVEPVTTTLAPEPPVPTLEVARVQPPPIEQNTSAAVSAPSLQPCGGDLPPCYVKWRESHGDYSARNNESAGAACGAWQIIGSTWADFEGYPDACSAPPAVQDEKARELWAGGAGCAHWSAC